MEVHYRSIASVDSEAPPPPPPPPPPGVPKIAFLFIARNRLPLDVVWDAFFKVVSSCPEASESCFLFVNQQNGFVGMKRPISGAG